MTALTENTNTPYKGYGVLTPYVVKSGETVYQGGIGMIEAGQIKAASSGGSQTKDADIMVGLIEEDVTGDGTKTALVRSGIIARFANGDSIGAADVGKAAYVMDDGTVMKGTTKASKLGKIVQVDSDGVWVAIPLGGQ